MTTREEEQEAEKLVAVLALLQKPWEDPRYIRAVELATRAILEGRESAEPRAFNGLLPRYAGP